MYATAGSAPDHASNNVYCYNTNVDQWVVLPQPGHCSGILQMLDDKLAIFGGEDPITKIVFNKVTTYNSKNDHWYSYYPNMLNKRFKPGVIKYNNYVILMGGASGLGTIDDSIEVMEYRHKLQYKVSVHLPFPMWAIKPTLSGDNITVIGYTHAGGRNSGHHQIAVEKIMQSLCHPLPAGAVSPKWKELSPATHWDTVTVPCSNPPMIIGGCDNKGVTTSDVAIYDMSQKSWRIVDSLTMARDSVAVALLNNNTIIVIGGTRGGVGVTSAMESSLTTVEVGKIVP